MSSLPACWPAASAYLFHYLLYAGTMVVSCPQMAKPLVLPLGPKVEALLHSPPVPDEEQLSSSSSSLKHSLLTEALSAHQNG